MQDTEEASDSVQSSVDALSPRQYPDSDTETTEARRQMLEEMQEMQDRIHAVFSGNLHSFMLMIDSKLCVYKVEIALGSIIQEQISFCWHVVNNVAKNNYPTQRYQVNSSQKHY